MRRLREIKPLGRMQDEPRRWFTAPDADLIVWLDPAGPPSAFQFCYGKGDQEKALSWRPGAGFGHHAIDDGEDIGPTHKMTPILREAERIDVPLVTSLFAAAAVALPENVRRFVADKLVALAQGRFATSIEPIIPKGR